MEITGVTYSTSDYEHYNQNGDRNYFEEVVDKMILDGISGMNESFRNAIMSLDRDKKRMTILSLLDKDLNLFKRIKALTDKNIGKMDHIKDIILMLREYVKVGEVEKKKFGEVMTPLELVKEMLAKYLPDAKYVIPQNSYLAWIDISCLSLGDNASELLIENQKVAFNPGTEFGDQYGAYVRLNFATSPEIIEEGIKRLAS
jgi:hypothetical protein